MSAQGGSARNSYYLSGGYDKSKGILDEQSERLTFKMDNQFRPVEKLLIGVGLSYTNNNTCSGHPAYGDIRVGSRRIPYLDFADDSGNPLPVARNYRQPFVDTAGAGKYLNWNYYPLTDDQHSVTTGSRKELLTNIMVQMEIMKGINVEGRYTYQQQWQEDKTLHDAESFTARNLVNRFSQVNRSTGIVTYILPKGGMLEQSNTTITAHNARAQINVQREWNTMHQLFCIGGF